MSNLYENLKKLCDERDIKGGKMCTDLGLSKSLMTDLKAGRKRSITLPTAQKIADYFGVSVDYITGEDAKKEAAPITGSGLPEGYVQLTPENRAIVDRLIADLAKSQSKT